MTEDVTDVTTSSPVMSSEAKFSEQNIKDETFRKPMSVMKSEKRKKVKSGSVIDTDTAHSELKKKKKSKTKSKKQKTNDSENATQKKYDMEDATESVDSGCIADIAGDVTDWPQVETAVLEERNYVLSLLSWLPDFQWVIPDLKNPKPASGGKFSSKDEAGASGKNKKKGDSVGTKAKLREFINVSDELDGLREKYTTMLADLKQVRGYKKREGKLKKKIKNLDKRNKKNTNRQRKLEQAEIYAEKHKAIEKKKKAVKKNIVDEKGKLVFSKFDFSNDGSGMESKKAKNLEHKVAKAIKERETRKRLQMEGNLKAAADLNEIDAWSNALQRAEGVKVRDDIHLMQKTLKRKEIRKKTSKKRWEERVQAVEKKMTDRQTKRQDNLKARRDKNSEKKTKKLRDRGRIVPGF